MGKKTFLVSIILHILFAVVMTTDVRIHFEEPQVELEIMEPVRIPPPRERILPTNSSKKASRTAVPKSGVSRNSTVQDQKADSTAIGNTLSKAPDQLPSSDEALAAPADDYEVSVWPQLQNDIRIPYPHSAKAKEIEGPVVMDIYISDQGQVKKVNLISGPGYGLNEAAIVAARDFRFSPAKVGDRFVPVVIRYTYRFVIKK